MSQSHLKSATGAIYSDNRVLGIQRRQHIADL